MNLPMTIEEIKRKIKDEVPLQTIADLNGLDLKTFEKIIRQYEEESGEQILPKRKPGRPKTSTPARSTKYARAKAEREKKPAQVVAKVVPVEIKIEVDEDIMVEIANKIRSINDQMSLLSAYKTSWQKIYDVLKAKEGDYGD